MRPTTHRRHRRAKTRTQRSRLTRVLSGLALGVAIGVGGLLAWPRPSVEMISPGRQADAPPVASDAVSTDTAEAPVLGDGARPNYLYSVIPHGAVDSVELASAIERDGVVAEQYGGLTLSAVRAETVREPYLAYASYRIGAKVYWTKKKVQIASGETILTDGTTHIRARCGNGLSATPATPTLPDEPDLADLDRIISDDADEPGFELNVGPRILDPLGNLGGPLSSPFGLIGVPGQYGESSLSSLGDGSPTGHSLPDTAGPLGWGQPPVGDGWFPLLHDGDIEPPDPDDWIPPVNGFLPPGGSDVNPPGSGDPWPPGGGDGWPPNGGGPTSPEGDTNPPPDGSFPPTPPINPAPVPEPATLLLVAGGAGGMILRRIRAHRRSSPRPPLPTP